jgi:hypothetical protein
MLEIEDWSIRVEHVGAERASVQSTSGSMLGSVGSSKSFLSTTGSQVGFELRARTGGPELCEWKRTTVHRPGGVLQTPVNHVFRGDKVRTAADGTGKRESSPSLVPWV